MKKLFLQVQYGSACKIFGDINSAADFVKYAGTFYAQYLYEEFQHHRRRKPRNAGALIWMLNDCWPAASWSLIDYYGVPKQAYYAVKRASKPIMVSFRDAGDCIELYITHNRFSPLKGTAEISLMDVNGNKNILTVADVEMQEHTSLLAASVDKGDIEQKGNSFLVAEFETDGKCYQEIFFHNLWKNIKWPEPELKLELSTNKVDDKYSTTVDIAALKFARCVYISLKNEDDCLISDNYFDILPGRTKRVVIDSERELDASEIKVLNWLEEWD